MDSYNLFGDDGSGMLEGLTDISGSDAFSNNPGVTNENKDNADSAYRQPYQGGVSQESTLQKLPPFGGGASAISGSGQPVPTAGPGPPAPDYHDYGAYPPRPRMPQPPHASVHPSHHSHPGHGYPGYHPGPDPMYGLTDHAGMGEVWPSAAGPNRYTSMAPAYRHPYEHQQKMHQYGPQQGSSLGGLQSQNGSYLPRQPHFPQAPPQAVYGQQGYPSYTQMHPPPSSRIPQHPSYHQQMDVNPHQYGLPHNQQSHGGIPHQPHQSMGGHGASMGGGGMAGLHRSAPAPPYHAMGYQPHPLDVNVAGGAQYRPPFHHVSPQVSPRAQLSPRPPAPQVSPRPLASPGKPAARPHPPPPVSMPSNTNNYPQQNTLQALEQMVLPSGSDYPFQQRNPSSPASSHLQPVPWHSIKPSTPMNTIVESNESEKGLQATDPIMTSLNTANIDNSEKYKSVPNTGQKHMENTMDKEPSADLISQDAENSKQSQLTQIGVLATVSKEQRTLETTSASHSSTPSNNSNYTKLATSQSDNMPTSEEILIKPSDDTLKDISKIDSTPLEENSSYEKSKTGAPADGTNTNALINNGHPSCAPVSLPKSETTHSYEMSTTPHSSDYANNIQANTSTAQNNISGGISSNLTINPSFTNASQVPTMPNPNSPANVQSAMHSNHIANLNTNPNVPTHTSGTNTMQNVSTHHSPSTISSINNLPGMQNSMQANMTTINSGVNNMPSNAAPVHQNVQMGMSMGGAQNIPPNMAPALPQSIPSNMPPQNMPPNISHSMPPNISQTMPPNIPQNMPSNLPSNMPPNIPQPPNMSQNMPPNIAQNMPPNIAQNMPPNIAQNMPPNITQNMPQNIPQNMPANITQNMPPNATQTMPPNMQGSPANIISNIPHGVNPSMGMVMGPNNLPHPNLPPMYHHQERAAIQQQIQEIYCLPPSPQNQEKVRRLQERLAILQQHETTDKCNGGPNCILNCGYNQKMVESPQVTSTTGRGRGKGPPKPRKPRAKKEKPPIVPVPSLDQLPVSEDCVTAGTGLKTNVDMDLDTTEDMSNIECIDDTITIEKGKKARGPRKTKERKPRTPKEPKEEKPVKERKKREPKDPNAPKRKRNYKKDAAEFQADTTTNSDILDRSNLDNSHLHMSKLENNSTILDPSSLNDSSVTDFDDIPVSKIAIKDLIEEAEARRENDDDDNDSLLNVCLKKRPGRKRGSVASSKRLSTSKRVSTGKKRKRGGIVPDSDGEPDDMMSTPPPSPPQEGDDSLKRRSARHTQRKKYTDDVMLRLSDDEYPVTDKPKRESKESKSDDIIVGVKDVKSIDGLPKPNYMYVNTTEEDAMIVQHILACRMGKREYKEELPPIIPTVSEPEQNKPCDVNEQVIGDIPGSDLKSIIDENDELTKQEVASESAPEKAEDTVHIDTKVEGEALKNKEDTPNPKMPSITEECITEEKADITSEIKTEEEIKPKENFENKTDKNESNKKPVMVDVEEYFVKYRNFSYLHCEWKTEEELYKGDKRIFSKIKRFKQKQAQQINIFELLDDEPFNPDYVEVERILDVSENEDPANKSVVKHYLVKWKSLQYEDSTWELEEDVDIDKIKQFEKFSELPPKDKWKYKKRPSAEAWVQLKESPLYKGGNTLRPYQLEGLNWLLFSWHNGRNCILADEMGLGKTIQSLTFVNSVWETGIRGPFLIIAPLSTIPNWQREFEGWTDMNVIVYHGSQQSKSMIQEYEFYFKNENGEPIKELTKFNVLITTFEIIVTDFQELKMFNWRVCVIDEAHRLKNRNCKLLEGLRQLHLEHRVLLSGTPLQNNVNELFSLLNFLEPSQFASNEAFLNDFGQLKTESEVLKLQALLKPMMLRRLKEDVEKSLAPKEETIIEVELTNIQKKYYRAILERNFSFLQKGTTSAANIPNLMNTMMELRKCCIHPYLLNGAEDQIQYDYKQANGEDKDSYYKALIQSSGKMVLVDKLLPKLKAGGHRILIFSQMVKCLDILEDYLLYRKYPYERIDGRIRGNLRQEAIDRYSKPDSDRFVFLLCTKAGGLGINLTAADTVIIYDSDWNPQNDLQAQARCHRIGQQKMVKIYRLICRNSYEREMFDKASLKLGLDKAILQSMNTTQGKETGIKQLSKKEIEDLLKKGAYGAVMDEDNAGDKFCEEDIEMILARRTQVIQMESEKGSTFSKASFAATDQRSDIDIRDPDFWNKWAKKADIDTTEKKEDEDLIVTEPRKRTIIKRYGHDDGAAEMSDEATPDSEDDEDGISLRSKRKKDKLGRKGRKYASDDYIPRHEGVVMDDEVVYGAWTRSECFKIERGLLTFGWARWDEIVDKNQLRKGWTQPVIEDCARIIVLYCLRHYKGDEKIRNFIWDLIEPCENGEVTIARNHSGLHNPVPRGRNAKKKNRPKEVPKVTDVQKWEDPNHWSSAEKYDCDTYLESSYKKHLFRHANKVLLRVRMMYYIKHEVIGDYATQIESGVHASALGMRVPRGVDSAPPRLWWDTECDVSLLVGTYVHGYENYLAMRADPKLCFVDKLGPPDPAECKDIKESAAAAAAAGDEECTDGGDEVSSGAGAASPGAASPGASPRADDDVPTEPGAETAWPPMQDLNTRLRRLITAYQRNYKREELKMQQRAKMERRERMEQLSRDEAGQWRWSRADEEAFRRTVASYGVEFDPHTKSLRWARFRALARLDAKSDDALTDYLKAFMAMCKRQCGLSVGEAELPTRADLKAEPIGEERAIATLERIDLLRVLREEVAAHRALEARLALCERAPDAPPWWRLPDHDKLLVHAVCKHGLGDTYHKIFCDPKLPFMECARNYYQSQKSKRKAEPQKVSSDEDDDATNHSEESTSEPRMSLRRSKRNSNVGDRDTREDTDALSELESLAKVGRNEEALPPNHWFSERALETRLHHIAHAVQNCEWPSEGKRDKPAAAAAGKRHIAIDVETERAKLHALLSRGSPPPAPPPAHQRPPPAPAADAAPLDLSDPHPAAAPPPAHAAPPHAHKSRLDDTLSKLMKRKNVDPPEQIVGKEKKRKKLDEIVLGLSAAKNQSSPSSSPMFDSARTKTPVLANVSVTPVGAARSSPSPVAHKPFSVTVTSVPSPKATPAAPKELASFLQQSLEHGKGGKGKPPPLAGSDSKGGKWGGAVPRLAPDEHVPVVHRVTGKRLVGSKAPQLRHLAQWITDNPLYDIDAKWTEGIKEHVKLPADARTVRHAPPAPPLAPERKKGRPPSLDAGSSGLAALNPALLASLSAFDPKTLAATLSSLSGFDPKLLGSFDPKLLASLGSFDPKNNPLLSSFSSMPNLLGGNLFANLAGMGLPGFSGLDMASLGGGAGVSGDSKNKSRKPSDANTPSSSKSSSSQFPFVFPGASNMLYPQLGLGGLNPFGMHGGMSSAYDALGLLSGAGGLGAAGALGGGLHGHRSSASSTKTSSPKPATVVSGASHSRQQKTPTPHSNQMPQILLPPDTYLLESLTKQNYEALLKADKKSREGENHEATDLSKIDKKKSQYDVLRSQIPPAFAAVQEKLLKGDKKDIDISKMLLEQMASGALSASLVSGTEGKKLKESEKDLYEKVSKHSRNTMPEATNMALGLKRTHEDITSEPENLSVSQNDLKRIKSDLVESENKTSPSTHPGEMDLEDLIAPSTVIKTGMKQSDSKVHTERDKEDRSQSLSKRTSPTCDEVTLPKPNDQPDDGDGEKQGSGSTHNMSKSDENNSTEKMGAKKSRKLSEEGHAFPKRELRSSSTRQSTDT